MKQGGTTGCLFLLRDLVLADFPLGNPYKGDFLFQRGVAQFGRAAVSKTVCCGFEPHRPYQISSEAEKLKLKEVKIRMSKQGQLKKMLDQLGLTTRVEISHARTFIKGAVAERGGKIDEEELLALLGIYKRLMELDVRKLSNIPKSTVEGLGHVLVLFLRKGRLKFLSLASPDYRQDAKGRHIDIGDGTTKKEYHAPEAIAKELGNLGVPSDYRVLFADIDLEVVGKSPEEIKALLAKNYRGLCRTSGVGVKGLSQEISLSRFERFKREARSSRKLAMQIQELQNRATVRMAHNISREAIAERAFVYAALGKLLEEIAPETILADIQGRIYPYEQPFYDALRRFPLPLLRLVRM